MRAFLGIPLPENLRRGVRVASPPVERIGDIGAFEAERLVLFRSETGPGGSTYHELASYPLERSAAS